MSIIIQADLHDMLDLSPINRGIQSISIFLGHGEEVDTLPHASARDSSKQPFLKLVGLEVLSVINQSNASFIKLGSYGYAPLSFRGEPCSCRVTKVLGTNAWWWDQNRVPGVFDPIQKQRVRGVSRVCQVLNLH
ncbi:hypothetical protein V8G54_003637 [Vigna mungo]|uniref:Uncharacterized protein n=1 Tax=Vigna mungo TaxID=3915 RepID=A0AAQ3PB89_VIGMU